MERPADISARAEEEALRWLVDLEDLSEVEQARFHAWLDERPENAAAFAKVEREWRELDVLRRLATDSPDPDVVNKWLKRRRLRADYLPLAAVAGLALLAVGIRSGLPVPFEETYQTPVGQHRSIVLPDESVMTLNTNTEATVQYDRPERRVRLLHGEAHFAIAPVPNRPFSVAAGPRTVRAVGTAFSIRLTNDVVEVTVTDGVVEVLPATAIPTPHPAPARPESSGSATPEAATAAAAERLAEGQKLTYSETEASLTTVDPAELARELAWRDGMLDFQGNTLAEVIAEASRYTETRISIVDPEIAELHVTGYLRAGDVDTLLTLIDSNERVSVQRISPRLVHVTASRD